MMPSKESAVIPSLVILILGHQAMSATLGSSQVYLTQLAKLIDVSETICGAPMTCQHRATAGNKCRCSCDKFCNYRHDCCLDVIDRDAMPDQSGNETCATPTTDPHKLVSVIETCVLNSTEIYHTMCAIDHTFIGNILVSNKDTGKTYKNLICAICNGELESDLIPWTPVCNTQCRAVNISLMTGSPTVASSTGIDWNYLRLGTPQDQSGPPGNRAIRSISNGGFGNLFTVSTPRNDFGIGRTQSGFQALSRDILPGLENRNVNFQTTQQEYNLCQLKVDVSHGSLGGFGEIVNPSNQGIDNDMITTNGFSSGNQGEFGDIVTQPNSNGGGFGNIVTRSNSNGGGFGSMVTDENGNVGVSGNIVTRSIGNCGGFGNIVTDKNGNFGGFGNIVTRSNGNGGIFGDIVNQPNGFGGGFGNTINQPNGNGGGFGNIVTQPTGNGGGFGNIVTNNNVPKPNGNGGGIGDEASHSGNIGEGFGEVATQSNNNDDGLSTQPNNNGGGIADASIQRNKDGVGFGTFPQNGENDFGNEVNGGGIGSEDSVLNDFQGLEDTFTQPNIGDDGFTISGTVPNGFWRSGDTLTQPNNPFGGVGQNQYNFETNFSNYDGTIETFLQQFNLQDPKTCNLTFEPPSGIELVPTTCNGQRLVSKCDERLRETLEDFDLIELACRELNTPFVNSSEDGLSVVYKNVFCFMCSDTSSLTNNPGTPIDGTLWEGKNALDESKASGKRTDILLWLLYLFRLVLVIIYGR